MSKASDRLNVRLTGDSPERLKALTANGRTPSETVRKALALLELMEFEESRGFHFEIVADADPTNRTKLRFVG